MGLRNRIKRLERAAEENTVSFRQTGRSMSRFHEDTLPECLVHEIGRGCAPSEGQPVPPSHPLIEALREAADLGSLLPTLGSIFIALVDEDEVICGEQERPGSSVKWNAEGTICE